VAVLADLTFTTFSFEDETKPIKPLQILFIQKRRTKEKRRNKTLRNEIEVSILKY